MGKLASGDFSKTIKKDSDKVSGEIDPEAQYLTSVDAEKAAMVKLWPTVTTPT